MNRNRRIFIVIFILFTTLVILLAIDMGRRTTAPWNKRREAERAFQRDGTAAGTAADSLFSDDTLLVP